MDLDHVQNILDKLPDPVLLIDPQLRVVLANSLAQDLFDDCARGRHLLSFMRTPEVLDHVAEVLAGRPRAETRFVSRHGVERVFRVVTSGLTATDSGIDGALLAFIDVTQIEMAEEMHSDFVANVSHELRSPLTALAGFIETLQGPAAEDAAARQNFLAIMQTEADRMRRLIDDLLSLSRVEVNERVRPTQQVEVVGAIRAVCNSLAQMAAQAEVDLDLTAPPATVEILADPDEITQIFQNLIENAIKYSPGAPLEITVAEVENVIGVRGRCVRVDIRDHGAGIAAIHIPRLTERFYRIDSHRNRKRGGTGLGLAIVKHIISRHRGKLAISSTPGEGSCFSVILPKA